MKDAAVCVLSECQTIRKQRDYCHVSYMQHEADAPIVTNAFFKADTPIAAVKDFFKDSTLKMSQKFASQYAAFRKTVITLPNDMKPQDIAALAKRVLNYFPRSHPAVLGFHTQNRRGEKNLHFHLLYSPHKHGSPEFKPSPSLVREKIDDRLRACVRTFYAEKGYEIIANPESTQISSHNPKFRAFYRAVSSAQIQSGEAEILAKSSRLKTELRAKQLRYQSRETVMRTKFERARLEADPYFDVPTAFDFPGATAVYMQQVEKSYHAEKLRVTSSVKVR